MTRLGSKEKGKPRPYQRKTNDGKPDDFTKMRGFIWNLCKQLSIVKWIQLQNLYVRLWNPVNYAVIGGIGISINYLVNAILLNYMAWYFSNFVAILIAWSWNWANSVGPIGFLWGFEKKEKEKWVKQ